MSQININAKVNVKIDSEDIADSAAQWGQMADLLIECVKRAEPNTIAFAVAHLSTEDMKKVQGAINSALRGKG